MTCTHEPPSFLANGSSWWNQKARIIIAQETSKTRSHDFTALNCSPHSHQLSHPNQFSQVEVKVTRWENVNDSLHVVIIASKKKKNLQNILFEELDMRNIILEYNQQ